MCCDLTYLISFCLQEQNYRGMTSGIIPTYLCSVLHKNPTTARYCRATLSSALPYFSVNVLALSGPSSSTACMRSCIPSTICMYGCASSGNTKHTRDAERCACKPPAHTTCALLGYYQYLLWIVNEPTARAEGGKRPILNVKLERINVCSL